MAGRRERDSRIPVSRPIPASFSPYGPIPLTFYPEPVSPMGATLG